MGNYDRIIYYSWLERDSPAGRSTTPATSLSLVWKWKFLLSHVKVEKKCETLKEFEISNASESLACEWRFASGRWRSDGWVSGPANRRVSPRKTLISRRNYCQFKQSTARFFLERLTKRVALFRCLDESSQFLAPFRSSALRCRLYLIVAF